MTVDTIAQGTGAALTTARHGDADVVMVHARPLEDKFIQSGYGINRRDLMFNDFVIAGPKADPAEIAGIHSATNAFTRIAESNAPFVSRGDNSGTHTKERAIWDAADITPRGDWYQETGTGMGEALTIANIQGAYILSDRGTFLAHQNSLNLMIHVEGPIKNGPEILINPYGVIAVNPARHPHVEYQLAMAYIGYLTSPEAQNRIANYTVNGEQLFFPNALTETPRFAQYIPSKQQSEYHPHDG